MITTNLTTFIKHFLLVSLFLSTSIHAQNIPLDKIAALVNNDVIMLSEVKKMAFRIKQSGSNLPNAALIKESLDRLVLNKIQIQRAKELGIIIDDIALNRAVLSIAKQNKLNLEQFRIALGREGINYKAFRNSIREKLYIESLQKRQQGQNNIISEEEVDSLIQAESLNLNQNIQYHIIDILLPAKNGISTKQFNQQLRQAQYLEKRIAGKEDKKVKIISKKAGATINNLGWKTASSLSPAMIRALSLIGPGELSTVVRDASGFHILKLIEQRGGKRKIIQQARVRHILITKSDPQAKLKVVQLRNKILAGARFSDLAKKFSADKGSASDGGEIGLTDPASFVPPFAAAVRSLPLNNLSQPIHTRFGWHILEVLERKATDKTRAALKLQAQSLITDKKKTEEYSNWLQGLRDESFVEYRI